MYKQREKSGGWAAVFGQLERHKDGGHVRASSDPFPSLSGNSESVSSGNKHFSLVTTPLGFVAPAQHNNNNKKKKNRHSEIGDSSGIRRETPDGSNFNNEAFIRLKQQYSWADANLIQDIMVAAGSDINTASSLLKAMISDNVFKDDKRSDSKVNIAKTLPVKVSASKDAAADNVSNVKSDSAVDGVSDSPVEVNSMRGQLPCIPLEPEWDDDDDLYLTSRKDAIKMMRAATRHSKAATNSFQRGDHYSAQQFSLKAQEEWKSANRLNALAAREILGIRNESNGLWRLDLHGLHASEAVQAMQEHLQKIETQLCLKGSDSLGILNGYRTKADALHSSSVNGGNKMERTGEQDLCRPNLRWLEVITGIGNHSRGGAALPTAVKTFLSDNGYRIDEARPGVIMVRPKIRFDWT